MFGTELSLLNDTVNERLSVHMSGKQMYLFYLIPRSSDTCEKRKFVRNYYLLSLYVEFLFRQQIPKKISSNLEST